MPKKNVPSHQNLDANSDEKLTKTHTPRLMASYSGNIQNSYLPHMRTNYQPSDESVESATGVDFPINMPNPAVDSIVVNNISNAEFDYTEDMTSSENEEDDLD